MVTSSNVKLLPYLPYDHQAVSRSSASQPDFARSIGTVRLSIVDRRSDGGQMIPDVFRRGPRAYTRVDRTTSSFDTFIGSLIDIYA